MTYLTGFHAIEEVLRTQKRGEGTLYIAKKGPRIRKIEELAEKNGTPVHHISTVELNRLINKGNRGVALKTAYKPEARTLESFLEGLTEEHRNVLILILDGITDPHNLGALLRSADQFSVDFVCLPERRSAAETEVTANSSAGALYHVPAAKLSNLSRGVELLKKHGFWIYAAHVEGKPLNTTDLTGRVAVVMGSEGKGVSRNLVGHCDAEIMIPTHGKVDSLNVSVAGGIILYEIRRQQGW